MGVSPEERRAAHLHSSRVGSAMCVLISAYGFVDVLTRGRIILDWMQVTGMALEWPAREVRYRLEERW